MAKAFDPTVPGLSTARARATALPVETAAAARKVTKARGRAAALPLAFSLLLLQSPPAGAQVTQTEAPSAVPPISLQQAISEAVANNLELAAARHDLDVAPARLTTASAAPNPELQVGQSTDLAFSNEGEYQLSAGVSVPFPVAGRISRQKSVAAIDIDIAKANIADRQRVLVGEVKQAFYELLLADAQIALRGTLIESASELAAMTQTRFERGEISQVDVSTAQLEYQRLLAEREQLVLDRESSRKSFGALLGRFTDEPVALDGSWSRQDVRASKDELRASALARRPDLAAAALETERARAEQQLAKALKWEDWRAGVSYLRQKSVFSNAIPYALRDTDQLIDFGISIPLPLRDKKLGPLAEALAAEQRAQARVEALRLGIVTEVDRAYDRAKSVENVLKIYDSSVLVAANRNIDLVRKAYNQGMADFVQVILATQQLASQRQSYLDALGKLQQARLELETAVGTSNPEEEE